MSPQLEQTRLYAECDSYGVKEKLTEAEKAPLRRVLAHDVARFHADAQAVYSHEGTHEINVLVVGRSVDHRPERVRLSRSPDPTRTTTTDTITEDTP